MNVKRFSPLILLLHVLGGLAPSSLHGQSLPFVFIPRTTVFVDAAVQDRPGATDSGESVARAAIQGGESSQCNAGEQNISRAESFAEIRQDVSGPGSIGYVLKTSASAAGGHFVRCVTCPGICIGRLPSDTRAQASARARLLLDIPFLGEFPTLPYKLSLRGGPRTGSPVPVTFNFRLIDSQGTSLDQGQGPTIDRDIEVVGGPGKSLTLIVEAATEFSASGASGFETQAGELELRATLERVPLLEATDDQDPLSNGIKTQAFKPVGALLVDGQGICTGTLIGPRTVLTAAHCVFFESDPNRLKFIIGSNFRASSWSSAVQAVIVPRREIDGLEFQFAGFKNDIAILHLKSQFTDPEASPYELPESGESPTSIEALVQNQVNVTLVGFGKRSSQGSGEGDKRFITFKIAEAANDVFAYFNPGRSTCNGDSGAPVLMQKDGNRFAVIGIASTGNCKDRGIETRVDRYLDWIAKHREPVDPVAPTPAAP